MHNLKVKPNLGGYLVFLDDMELRGVVGLVLNMRTGTTPTVFLEMNVLDVDIAVEDAEVVREAKQ